MSEIMTGSLWMAILREAKEKGRIVVLGTKRNSEIEAEGKVIDVTPHLVCLSDPDEPKELCLYVLLDEIVAVGVLKGEND